MGTGYLLLDQPNRACAQLSTKPRRLSGVIVMHTAESAPDWVGPDTSAENVAGWITRREDPGSYHRLVDSDSTVPMAPWGVQCWHDKVTNPHSVGIAFATKAHLWGQLPEAHRDAMLRRGAAEAAAAARYIKATEGIDVPARWLTQAQAWEGVPGFVRHADSERVKGRRSDPWPADAPEADLFLTYYRQAMAGELSTTSIEETLPMSAFIVRDPGRPQHYVTDGLTKRYLGDPKVLAELVKNDGANGGGLPVRHMAQYTIDRIPDQLTTVPRPDTLTPAQLRAELDRALSNLPDELVAHVDVEALGVQLAARLTEGIAIEVKAGGAS